ncbi:uncharacterized protein EI90DRAFT_3063843 [Cantharellus anzutake]|uniref:uncharacterized protein n=1 Tax=Cantharellus anzutake TaxID=1750568 RepID=UPI0019051FDA|nr:uncharacterized protein EI90DRAFT_3063843 [Cantharellus anzutake]KAF8328871.1 hypothetical protein EI90DRAFT_3063843 [Cantharellus anzutake]
MPESHRWTTLNLIEFVHVPQEPTAPVASISSTFTPSTFTSVSSTSTTSTLRAAPPSASSQQYGGSSDRRGAIAGGIVGGVVAIGIAVFLIACSRRLVFRGLFHKFRHVSRFSCGGRSNGLDTPGETRTDRLGNEAAPVASSGALFPSDCRADTQQGDILNAGHSAPPSMTPRMHTTEDSTHPIASYWSRRTVQRSPGNAPPSAFHTEGCRATRLSGTIRNSHTVTQNEADTANSEFTTSLQPQNPEMLLFAPTPRSDFHRAHVGSTSPTQGIPLMSNSTPPSSFLQNFNVSSFALHDRLSTSSTQQSSGEIGRVSSPSLTQISMAVNEILVELAKLRITPGEPVDEGADPAFHDEEAPPLYGTHDSALYTHEMLRSSSNGSH